MPPISLYYYIVLAKTQISQLWFMELSFRLIKNLEVAALERRFWPVSHWCQICPLRLCPIKTFFFKHVLQPGRDSD